jgi:hypothetical protein
MSTNNAEGMGLNMNVYKISGGKQKVSVGQTKGFTKWEVWIKCKKMNEGQNFCKITKITMAGSELRTSMCKYKDGNIVGRHNAVMGRFCQEAK